MIHALKAYPDTLSASGAHNLAKQIERFWHSKGFLKVRADINPLPRAPNVDTRDMYQVRSNLSNGWPPL